MDEHIQQTSLSSLVKSNAEQTPHCQDGRVFGQGSTQLRHLCMSLTHVDSRCKLACHRQHPCKSKFNDVSISSSIACAQSARYPSRGTAKSGNGGILFGGSMRGTRLFFLMRGSFPEDPAIFSESALLRSDELLRLRLSSSNLTRRFR